MCFAVGPAVVWATRRNDACAAAASAAVFNCLEKRTRAHEHETELEKTLGRSLSLYLSIIIITAVHAASRQRMSGRPEPDGRHSGVKKKRGKLFL